ncbi:hypothetical protein [Pseudoalteromonas sp. SG44-17]|uniref:hypothetical protein n=1 Tax=Pseudoalteromonas sp. SG44-17 TaxID=2760963 RepID=UPI001600AF29|nr:hypothetical protein [Pseudoalteromonas sp. SG44-17]MBB1408240.1 hypothetical protein [Pseudoalteromonas sp. SG44-17]
METELDLEALWDECITMPDASPDVKYAKQDFFNRTEQQIFVTFDMSVIESASELRKITPPLFNLYFPYFQNYILKCKHNAMEANDIASCYIRLLVEKLQQGIVSNKEIIEKAVLVNKHFRENLCFYNDCPEVYGDLKLKLDEVDKLLAQYEIK